MIRAAHVVAVCGLAIACDASPEPDDCALAGCDLAGSGDELRAALADFGDPVAVWLREAVAADGVVADGPEDALAGLRAAMDCADDRERAFVVLSNAAFAPKVILTECSDDPIAASTAFVVFEPDRDAPDVDPMRLRMVGWDDVAQAFHRYQFEPHGDGLGVAVEPAFCTGCHGGPFARTQWNPIMNEMHEPWAQWNATPGFVSFAFDEVFPRERRGPVFAALTDGERLDSASQLEPIVRAAIDRTTAARIAGRAAPASLAGAAELIRPVFCDESANFVSEIHDSGTIALAAAIDSGLVRALRQLAPTAAWSFLADDAMVLPPPAAGEQPLVLVGVRGETSVQMEAALLSRRVLTPIDVLRVRALDWVHPVASSYRCELFTRALERADAHAPAQDTEALARALFELALAQAGTRSLAVVGPDQVVVLADADDTAARADIARGELAPHTLSISALGDAIEAHVDALASADGRARLDAERIRRGCLLRARDPIAPIIPDTDACP